MKNKVTVSYGEILNIRRGLRYNSDFPNILCYERFGNDLGYELFLGLQTFTAVCIIDDTDDVIHFETFIKPFCNQIDAPDMLILPTHDFSDASTWVGGDENSFYAIQPMSGKEYVLHSILGKMSKSLTFGSEQHIKFVLWQSTTEAACPVAGNSLTVFADSFYNPYSGVFSGWAKVFPSAGVNQKPNIWYYFDNNTHTYTVTEFIFETLDDFLEQSRYQFEENTVRLTYEYKEFGAYLSLRSSKNERIEIYSNDNLPLSIPEGESIRSVISCVLLSYDEF